MSIFYPTEVVARGKETLLFYCSALGLNPSRPEFNIVIFIHYKPRIAVATPDLQW